jgi:phosphoribosylanthranilate isomerase
VFVKICGITNVDDAMAAVDAGADALGFNFYPRSPRYISPGDAFRIVRDLPANIVKVGIFVDENPRGIMSEAHLDVAQLYGSSTGVGLRAWRAVASHQLGNEIARYESEETEAYLLDAPSRELRGGTGVTFPWEIARGAAALTNKKIIVAGGLDELNVQQAIAEAHPWGVDACSRIETQPGRKDHGRMKKFIEAAHAGVAA